MTDTTETVTLSRPLKTHSGEVTSITLKEPTAGLFFENEKDPYKATVAGDEGSEHIEFEFNNRVLRKFLADMTGFDDLVLSGLHASDYIVLRHRAVNMIYRAVGSNPTVT